MSTNDSESVWGVDQKTGENHRAEVLVGVKTIVFAD
jgi:hypothetical protein